MHRTIEVSEDMQLVLSYNSPPTEIDSAEMEACGP